MLVRWVKRARWESRRQVGRQGIPADAVTADLQTKGNTLSVWRCSNSTEDELRAVVVACAAERDNVDRVELAWITVKFARKKKLEVRLTPSGTRLASLANRHHDLVDLDLLCLVRVASLFARGLVNEQYRSYTRSEVKTILVDAVRRKVIALEELSEGVQAEVRRVMGNAGGPRTP
jgi:hypothetical protein